MSSHRLGRGGRRHPSPRLTARKIFSTAEAFVLFPHFPAHLYVGPPRGPVAGCPVQLLSYPRRDGTWDAYVFEPPGVLPAEWESSRVDGQHVFVRAYAGAPSGLDDWMDDVGRRIAGALGPGWEVVAALREEQAGERKRCQRALHWLHKANATGYRIENDAEGHAVLWVRRRDVSVLVRAGLVASDRGD